MDVKVSATTVEKVIPAFPSLDFDRSIAFYEQKLGFKLSFRLEGRAGLERDGLEIHLWPCNDKHAPSVTSCLVIVKNIEALYDEYKQSNVIHPHGALELKPWGMKQFSILDVDGNLVEFAEHP